MHRDRGWRSGHVDRLHQDQVRRQHVRVATASRHERRRAPSDDHEARPERARAKRFGRQLDAQHVADQDDPAATGQRFDVFFEAPRVAFVVDGSKQAVRAVLLDDLELRGSAARGDHLGAEVMRDLDGGQAGAAGGAEDQHGLAGAKPRAIHERVVGGLVASEQARALQAAELADAEAKQRVTEAMAYVLGSVALSIGALWVGLKLARWIWVA